MLVLPNHLNYSYLAICLCMANAPALATTASNDVKDDKQVERIEITGRKYEQAFPSLPEVKAELKAVAGGTNLVELNKLPARQATLQDAVGFEPGVMMQSFFGGNDQPRLNIRGSGIQSNPVNRGIQLLYDGLPINAADGSFIIGFLDPKSTSMISVYRGANGLRYGATTLGGAVNMISRNGTSSPSAIRAEYGSDDRIGLNGQFAGSHDKLDYFASASYDSYGGYRNHSESERSSFSGNIGYTFSDNVYNRTYLNVSDSFFEIPFVVPKSRALSDPKQVLGDGTTPLDSLLNVYNRNPFRDSQQIRVANKTQISSENSLHEMGVFYQDIDDTFTDPLNHTVTESKDYGLEYAYMTNASLLSAQDNILISLSANQSDIDRAYFANNPANGTRLQQFGDLELSANNVILALQWQSEFTDSLHITAAGQWVNSNRDIESNTTTALAQDKSYTNFNPKLGVNYLLSDEVRFFANISKTAEAPTFWELVSTKVSPMNPSMASVSLNNLEEQSATTLEIGTVGKFENIQWDIALYRSDVDDELLSVVSDFAVNGKTENYQAGTIHQGVELELTAKLTNDWINSGTQVATKIVYNYSDFYFDGGQYDGNQIAGVPEHLIQAELSFTSDSGLYIAPNIRWQPDDSAADHANSQFQDDYLLVGIKAAYQMNKDIRFYLDAENLTDEVYQTTYVIRGFSKATQPTFLPGFGPSISAGFQITF